MKPAFSSRRQAAGFVVLLGLLLMLPALLAGIDWGDRRKLYASIPNTYGPYPWIEQKIFTETNDVDIAFLGSSHLWYGVNTLYVQQKLSQQVHREAEVFTLGWNWAGYDMLYLVARDLLNQRRVHTIVIQDEYSKRDRYNFHRAFRYWYRVGEAPEMLADLKLPGRLRLYGIAATGIPRQLLNLLRSNPIPKSASETVNVRESYRKLRHMDDPMKHLGAAYCRGRMTDSDMIIDSTKFQPVVSATYADVLVYDEKTRASFSFSGAAVPPYQLRFARMLSQLCRERGTQIVIMHFPTFDERDQTTILGHEPITEAFSAPFVGIPGGRLFSGIQEADAQKLFLDPTHLNMNGQELFTQTVVPTLLTLYAKPVEH